MENPRLSIIMPVYNAGKYVADAIKSIIEQSFKDWELIIVNDGSTDNSLAICQMFAKEDQRIICYSKQNGGQASARNLALDKIRGEYITFMDADDVILDYDTYKKALRYLEEDPALEVVQFRCFRVFENGNKVIDFYSGNRPLLLSGRKEIFEHVEVVSDYVGRNRSLSSGQCDKIFRCQIFNGLRYAEGVVFEDTALSVHVFNRIDSILLIPEGAYGYYIRENSTTTKERSLKVYKNQLDSQLSMLHGLIENGGEKEDIKKVTAALRRFIIGVYSRYGLKADLSTQIRHYNYLCVLAKLPTPSENKIKLSAAAHIAVKRVKALLK